ncbi:MAG: DegT/DnrJ/EryC1/StrS family aminotransferase, partial [Ktedonobacteraceae bacterium]
VHLQPASLRYGYAPGTLPVTEAAAARIVSLPMYPELTTQQIERVVEVVKKASRPGIVAQDLSVITT